jgi:hypothetical protein
MLPLILFSKLMTHNLRITYYVGLWALIAAVKCLDKSIQLRVMGAESSWYGCRRLIGRSHITTDMNKKSDNWFGVDFCRQPARRCSRDEDGQTSYQWIHHTGTRWLSIAASMGLGWLRSNWVDWQIQKRFHHWYTLNALSQSMQNLHLTFLQSLSDNCIRNCE